MDGRSLLHANTQKSQLVACWTHQSSRIQVTQLDRNTLFEVVTSESTQNTQQSSLKTRILATEKEKLKEIVVVWSSQKRVHIQPAEAVGSARAKEVSWNLDWTSWSWLSSLCILSASLLLHGIAPRQAKRTIFIFFNRPLLDMLWFRNRSKGTRRVW